MKKTLLLFLTFLMTFAVIDDAYSQTRRDQRRRERQIRQNLRTQSNYRGERNVFLPPSQRRISVGVAMNSFNYFGDLSPNANFYSTDISFTRPGAGVYVNYRALSNRIDIESGFNWGTLRGSDTTSSALSGNTQYNYIRNLSFRNQIYELSVLGKVYLYQDGNGGTLQRKTLNPYLLFGGGVFVHNPKGQVPEMDYTNHYAANGSFGGTPITMESHGANPGDWVPLRGLRTEGQGLAEGKGNPYSLVQGTVIGGLGVRYRLADYLDLSFEVGIRYLFFDYIDDVSGTYVDLGLLESDLARVMSDRSLETLAENGGALSDEYIRSLYPSKYQFYTSAGDGRNYAILPGRGRSSDLNTRGNQANDVYYIAAFKLSYILGGSLKSSNQFR